MTEPKTLNRYPYSIGDPVNYYDPSGNFVFVIAAEGIAMAVAAVLTYVAAQQATQRAIDYIYSTDFSNPFDKAKGEEKTETKVVPDIPDSKKPIIFPANPDDFKPKGLVSKPYNNGLIIKWFEPPFKHELFEYDIDTAYGNHYHVIPKSWEGKHGWPSKANSHFYPGMQVPEPFATIYFR